MKEINEKDLGKATGGISGNRVNPMEKCSSWEAKSESVKDLPEYMQSCSNCAHFNAFNVNGGTCKLR